MPLPIMVCLHCYQQNHDKFYNLWIEKRPETNGGVDRFWVMFAYGKASKDSGLVGTKGTWHTLDAAQVELDELLAEKVRKGYVNVLSWEYTGGHTYSSLMSKVGGGARSFIPFRAQFAPGNIPPRPAPPVMVNSMPKVRRVSPSKPDLADTMSRCRRSLE